jgi:ankyrin repeat protein
MDTRPPKARLLGLAGLLFFIPPAHAAPGTSQSVSLSEKIHQAIQHRDMQALMALCNSGADLRVKDVNGGTPLHEAVIFWGDQGVIEAMLARGAEVNARDDQGRTPLLVAVAHAHYLWHEGGVAKLEAVVSLLVKHGATVETASTDGRTALRSAMEHVQVNASALSLVETLLKHSAKFPADALITALANGAGSCNQELLRLVLARAEGLDLTLRETSGGTFAHCAADSPKTLFLLEWLEAHGVDLRAVDSDGCTVFAEAAGAVGGNIPALEWLRARGHATMQPNSYGSTPLHLAALDPRPAVLQWLIAAGADLSARDALDRRSLDVAIDTHCFAFRTEEQKRELVTLLGGTEADVARGRFYDHRLHLAGRAGDLSAIKRLLKAGGDPNVKDESGDTLLRTAIDRVSRLPFTPDEHRFGERLLPLLFEYGADATLRMGDGMNCTYEEHARSLGVSGEFERARRRYAPRKKS